MGGFLAFAPLHASAVGLARTSIPLFVYGIVVVICRIAFAKVPDRLPSLPVGASALVAIAAGLTIMALWSSPMGMIIGTALMAIGVTFSTPAFFTAIFRDRQALRAWRGLGHRQCLHRPRARWWAYPDGIRGPGRRHPVGLRRGRLGRPRWECLDVVAASRINQVLMSPDRDAERSSLRACCPTSGFAQPF